MLGQQQCNPIMIEVFSSLYCVVGDPTVVAISDAGFVLACVGVTTGLLILFLVVISPFSRVSPVALGGGGGHIGCVGGCVKT